MISRNRWRLVAWMAVLVALGLGSRRAGMPPFVVLYAGDVFWGAFFFTLGAFLWPRAAPGRLFWGAVVVTELIEASQAWQAPWLVAIRETSLGGLLLGHGFLWSDVLCVALGAAAALVVDSLAHSPRCTARRRDASTPTGLAPRR